MGNKSLLDVKDAKSDINRFVNFSDEEKLDFGKLGTNTPYKSTVKIKNI